MAFDPERLQRRSIRFEEFDYSRPGAYLIILCAHDRTCLFGDIIDGAMELSESGRMVYSVWEQISEFSRGVEIDEFIIMPNHIHGIIVLAGGIAAAGSGQVRGPAPALAVSEVVKRFKTMTTERYIDGVRQSRWPPFASRLWQRNYYEHIIRNEESLERIRKYIVDNPAQRAFDHENPEAMPAQREDGR